MNVTWLKENWLKLLLVVAAIALAVTLIYLSTAVTKQSEEHPMAIQSVEKNPIATITMESGEQIRIELFPNKAPNTVNNFIALANSGYYDGVIFHRIIEGFVIQGGDPDGTGMGGPGYKIKGEFYQNGFKPNDITHDPGVISMARSKLPDSAGSQFFIVVGDEPFVKQSLDNKYAGFGKTADEESLKACMELSKVTTGKGDRPEKPPVMKTVRVETFDEQYPEPQKITN